jgi:hypothetical protein
MIRLNRPSVFNQGGPEKVGTSVFGGMGSGIVGGEPQMPYFDKNMVIQGMPGPVMNAQATPARPPSPAMGGLMQDVAAMPAAASPSMPSVFAAQPQDIPMSDAAMQTGFLAGQGMPSVKKPSVFDRIGEFINSPEGRMALIASAGATMQGGLGAGITAGLGAYNQYGQQQAQMDAQNRRLDQGDRGLEIDQQRADVDAVRADAQIKNLAVQAGLDVAKLQEAIRKNKSGEALDAAELEALQWYREQQVRLGDQNAALTASGQQIDIFKHTTPSASTAMTQDRTDNRYFNPPAPAITTTTSTKTKAEDGAEVTTATRSALPRITTQEAYDRLPRGAKYMDSQGNQATKR